MRIKVCGFIISAVTLAACTQDKNAPTDTPVSGSITICVDEGFSPVIESEVSTFGSQYKYANINARYVSETEAFRDLLNDSARLIIVSRKLTSEEQKYFEQKKLFPDVTKIATDAVAFIVNKENKDTAFTLEQVKKIMSGEVNKWNQLNPNSPVEEIRIVFDSKTSGMARYMQETLNGNKPLPPNSYAVDKNKEVVDYVAANKNALGVIGVNWISDDDDPMTTGFLEKINVVAIGDSTGKEFNKPYQAYIATKVYPFCRDIYVVSREARAGLGTGFAAFLAGDVGQRIILKSGLVPATMPVRILDLK